MVSRLGLNTASDKEVMTSHSVAVQLWQGENSIFKLLMWNFFLCTSHLLGLTKLSQCSVTSVLFDSLQPHGPWPARLLCPWDSPGKNSGWGRGAWVAISFSSDKVWSEWSEVSQLCLTLCIPMDCSLPDSSVHGIFQARVLEWVVISFSRAPPVASQNNSYLSSTWVLHGHLKIVLIPLFFFFFFLT